MTKKRSLIVGAFGLGAATMASSVLGSITIEAYRVTAGNADPINGLTNNSSSYDMIDFNIVGWAGADSTTYGTGGTDPGVLGLQGNFTAVGAGVVLAVNHTATATIAGNTTKTTGVTFSADATYANTRTDNSGYSGGYGTATNSFINFDATPTGVAGGNVTTAGPDYLLWTGPGTAVGNGSVTISSTQNSIIYSGSSLFPITANKTKVQGNTTATYPQATVTNFGGNYEITLGEAGNYTTTPGLQLRPDGNDGGNLLASIFVTPGGNVSFSGSYFTYVPGIEGLFVTPTGNTSFGGATVGSFNSWAFAPAGGPSHTAVLTITGNSTPAYAAYSGNSYYYTPVVVQHQVTNSGNITVTNTEEPGGYYLPGTLNKINGGAGTTTGSAAVNGFVPNDPEIFAAALQVADGSGTHEPNAQEITDLITDLQASLNFPSGWAVTVEPFVGNGTAGSGLTTDYAAAANLLNVFEAKGSGGSLDVAFIVTTTGTPVSPQTFGLDFSGETSANSAPDGITSVVVTDIAVVPEPTTISLVMMLGGIPLVVGNRRRRRL